MYTRLQILNYRIQFLSMSQHHHPKQYFSKRERPLKPDTCTMTSSHLYTRRCSSGHGSGVVAGQEQMGPTTNDGSKMPPTIPTIPTTNEGSKMPPAIQVWPESPIIPSIPTIPTICYTSSEEEEDFDDNLTPKVVQGSMFLMPDYRVKTVQKNRRVIAAAAATTHQNEGNCITLQVPFSCMPRRRHSWICG